MAQRLSSRRWRALAVVAVGVLPVSLVGAQVRSTDPLPTRPDQAEIARARAEIDTAQRRLQSATIAFRTRWEASDEFTSTQRELDAAQRAYDDARRPVLERLRQSDDYRRAQDEAQQASDRVRREQEADAQRPGSPATQPASDQPVDPRLADAAQRKLEQRTEVSRMEADALAKDPDVTKARQRLDEAARKSRDLQQRYQAALLNDPELVAARDQLAVARANAQTAGNSNTGQSVTTPPAPFSGNTVSDPANPTGGINPGGNTATPPVSSPPAPTTRPQ